MLLVVQAVLARADSGDAPKRAGKMGRIVVAGYKGNLQNHRVSLPQEAGGDIKADLPDQTGI